VAGAAVLGTLGGGLVWVLICITVAIPVAIWGGVGPVFGLATIALYALVAAGLLYREYKRRERELDEAQAQWEEEQAR
jgi:membrane protein implicated in regulation of membrane protease activity